MIVQRIFAILSAILLVSAVAMATLGPQSISLGQAIFMLNHHGLDSLVTWSNKALGAWAWRGMIQPMLVRPVWLLPASAGIICAGLSMSFSNRKSPHHSHRRS